MARETFPRFSSALLRRARKIKLLAMDVDGVLTGGEIIILDSGEEVKVWSVKDRMGFALLKHSGLSVKLAWITARKSKQVETRAKEIGVHYLFQNSLDKWAAIRSCMEDMKISAAEVAYIGDDFVDLCPLQNAGLAVCPPDSPDELKAVCHYRTRTASGKGVAREVIDLILKARGGWKKALSVFSRFLPALLLPLVLSACYSPSKASLEVEEKPDQWVEKFTITETRSGLPVWILNSENAQVFNKKKKVVLENIQIQFMNPAQIPEEGTQQSRESLQAAKKALKQAAMLSAPRGEVQTDTRDLMAWGGVEVQAEDGSRLYAEQLRYSTAKRKILSDSAIKIVRGESILLGEGLEASPDLSTVRILRHQASLYPKTLSLR